MPRKVHLLLDVSYRYLIRISKLTEEMIKIIVGLIIVASINAIFKTYSVRTNLIMALQK